MNKIRTPNLFHAGAACALLACAAPVAFAGDGTWFGDSQASGQWMVGLKGGNMVNEKSGYGDAANRGVMVGYTFARPVGPGHASVELEMNDTYDDGNVDLGLLIGGTGTWTVTSKALYLAYRTKGTVYFKGKLGAVIADYKQRPTDGPELTEDDAATSLGGGLGMRLGKHANVELEYTGGIGINDINYVSLGANLNF